MSYVMCLSQLEVGVYGFMGEPVVQKKCVGVLMVVVLDQEGVCQCHVPESTGSGVYMGLWVSQWCKRSVWVYWWWWYYR